jgi:putative intracellular protease/amidase
MTATTTVDVRATADLLIAFLETGIPPEGLFDPDVFLDFTMPTWRLQARGVEDSLALRSGGHPGPGEVVRSRFDPTATGFVLEVEEVWDDGGEHWYCRELFRADVGPAGITDLAVYCTGDWTAARVAQHARSVTLIRP